MLSTFVVCKLYLVLFFGSWWHGSQCYVFCLGDLQSCRPFFVGDKQVGLVQPNVLEAIRRHPEAFWEDPLSGNVWLNPSLKTYDERSERIDSVLRRWKEESLFITLKGWREEVEHHFFHYHISNK